MDVDGEWRLQRGGGGFNEAMNEIRNKIDL